MKNYKNIFLGLVFTLALVVIGGNTMFNSSQVTKASACFGGGTHWGNWVDISSCIATSCGTTNGTKTQERTCESGGCGYICKLAHQECEKGCPEVTWSTSQCPGGYSLSKHTCPGKCRKNDSFDPAKCVDALSFGPITFTYEKSADPNKCHRPTGSSLGVPSWAESAFNNDNFKWKFEVDINCHEVLADKETQTVDCNDAPYVECELSPTPTDEPEATPTPTNTPSNGGTGGPGDGLSDGRSDGRSSCPECTQNPNVGGAVLGASTGPTKAVLGLSTTSGENELIKLAQVFGSFVLSMFGLAFYKKSA